MARVRKTKKSSQHQDKSREIAQLSHRACHLPGNNNGPDLDKGGKKGRSGTSDLA